MKVLICDPVSDQALNALKEAGVDVTVKTGMNPDELKAEIPAYEAMVVRSATKVRREIIDAATNLKLIVRGGVGLDNIDVEYAREKGIDVRNTPSAASDSVAELALGMMFALARHIGKADRSMREGKWEKKLFKGTELQGKRLGIIGTGRIGRALARKAHALGMEIIGYDAYITTVDEPYITMTTLDDLLAKSDYISLHIPFDPAKGAILGEKEFQKVRPNLYLINCARGGVVDEAALLRALDNGWLAGAAIDVWEKEPTDNLDLVRHPNTICTPHIGASSKEGQDRVGDEIVKILTRS